MRLSDIYDREAEQQRLYGILAPRYARMLRAVHELVRGLLAPFMARPDEFRLDDPATRAVLDQAAEHVVLIDQATRSALREQLRTGQQRGYSSYQLAYGVPAEGFAGIDGLFRTTWQGRAETVARTELAHAQNIASLDRYAASGVVQRVRLVENDDTDAPCASRNGAVVSVADRPGLLHPNCLPGDQLVWAPDVVGASWREFEGELVTLRTATDQFLTCTPNHPILTLVGWLPAHALTEGQDVVCGFVAQGEAVIGALHDDQVPARIEEVARTLAVAVHGPPRTVPGAAPQFHGDGRANSDVHVVRADGLDDHAGGGRVGREQPLAHLLVERTDSQTPLLTSLGPPHPPLEGVVLATPGGVRRLGDRGALRVGGAAHPQGQGFACGAGEARVPDPLGGRAGVDLEQLRDPRARHALIDVQDAERAVRGAPAPRQVVAGPPQVAVQGRRTDAGVAGHVGQATGMQVAAVQVVQVWKKYFAGHVYNLETTRGWYVAQGIVTHNCRLGLVPVVETEAA